jgi:hypothetical protein
MSDTVMLAMIGLFALVFLILAYLIKNDKL